MKKTTGNQLPKLEVNQEAIEKINEVPHALLRLDHNIQELQQMVNRHREEEQEIDIFYQQQATKEYEKLQRKEEQQEIIKKETRKKTIKAALYIAAGVALSTFIYKGRENIEGKYMIVNEFKAATSNFGIMEYSDTYQINEGDQYVDLTTGVEDMIEIARKKGMTDQKIAIGLTVCMNKKIAENALGKELYPSYKERQNLYQEAYHLKELEQIQTSIEQGKGK